MRATGTLGCRVLQRVGKRIFRSTGAGSGIEDQVPLVSLSRSFTGLPTTKVEIQGIGVQESLLDTGAAVNIIDATLVPDDCNVSRIAPQLFTANGVKVHTGGQVKLLVTALGETSLVDFVILSNSVSPIILGYEWCQKNGFF